MQPYLCVKGFTLLVVLCFYPQVIKRDLEDCEAHITALETLVSSSLTNRTKFERLYADWKLLYKAVRVRRVCSRFLEVLMK